MNPILVLVTCKTRKRWLPQTYIRSVRFQSRIALTKCVHLTRNKPSIRSSISSIYTVYVRPFDPNTSPTTSPANHPSIQPLIQRVAKPKGFAPDLPIDNRHLDALLATTRHVSRSVIGWRHCGDLTSGDAVYDYWNKLTKKIINQSSSGHVKAITFLLFMLARN